MQTGKTENRKEREEGTGKWEEKVEREERKGDRVKYRRLLSCMIFSPWGSSR